MKLKMFFLNSETKILAVPLLCFLSRQNNDTFSKISKAKEQHDQAVQNFNYADKHHVDKSIRELNSAKDRLTLLLMQAIREVQDRA